MRISSRGVYPQTKNYLPESKPKSVLIRLAPAGESECAYKLGSAFALILLPAFEALDLFGSRLSVAGKACNLSDQLRIDFWPTPNKLYIYTVFNVGGDYGRESFPE